MKMKNNRAFTLMEVLVVIGLIALLLTAALILFNPKRQIERAWDAQRKHDLATLRKVIEDYYNDKNRYPNAAEICYPDTLQQVGDVCSCFICGKASGSPSFSPYLTLLPCDPEHPAKNYFYEYDCAGTQISWYRTYAKLAEVTSIGPYNYCRSSDNVDCPLSPTPTPTTAPTAAPTPTPTTGPSPTPTSAFCPDDPTAKYCYKQTVCNNCGTFTQCQLSTKCSQPVQLYSDFVCSVPCSSKAVTPSATPTPTPTPTLPPTQPSCPADPAAKYCFKGTLCNNCSDFANCNSPGICNSPLQLYSDFNCTNPCKQ